MIIPINKSHAGKISEIHIQTLRGDFLPSLGFNFLKVLYKGTLGKKNIWGYCYQNSQTKQIEGFIIGTDNIRTFFATAMKSEGLLLCGILIFKVITKPLLIKNILSTVLYPQTKNPSAELVIICVSKKSQGQGIGKKLIKSLEHQFRKEKIFSYKLTVHQEKSAIYFYEHLGFQKKSSFSLYGKGWLVYHRYFD